MNKVKNAFPNLKEGAIKRRGLTTIAVLLLELIIENFIKGRRNEDNNTDKERF